MKYGWMWCVFAWMSLCLPVTAQAGIEIVDGKLWQEQVTIYEKPNGKAVYTVTRADDPCREVRVGEGGSVVKEWLAVATFTPDGGILTGYVPALAVVAYTKDNTRLFGASKSADPVTTFKKNYIFYFLEFTGGSRIKGTLSDGKKDWTGWINTQDLTTTP